MASKWILFQRICTRCSILYHCKLIVIFAMQLDRFWRLVLHLYNSSLRTDQEGQCMRVFLLCITSSGLIFLQQGLQSDVCNYLKSSCRHLVLLKTISWSIRRQTLSFYRNLAAQLYQTKSLWSIEHQTYLARIDFVPILDDLLLESSYSQQQLKLLLEKY